MEGGSYPSLLSAMKRNKGYAFGFMDFCKTKFRRGVYAPDFCAASAAVYWTFVGPLLIHNVAAGFGTDPLKVHFGVASGGSVILDQLRNTPINLHL